MPENREMISLAEAFEIVEQELSSVTLPVETVPVRQGFGRIVVEDQTSCLDLPPFDKSAMDGYAVLKGDLRQEYRLIEIVPAGKMPSKKLEPGTTIKVMTGAPVPEGAGQVIMVEQTSETDGKVQIISHSKATNICPKGQDISCGDLVLKAPAVMGPLEIANLISVGIAEVKVSKAVRISILTTGNEIVDFPDQLVPGKIMNSNGPMLESLCQRYSLKIVTNKVINDDKDVIVSAIREALDAADIVVLSGGVSVGDFDFVAEAMKEAGLQLHFTRVAIKPGKPMTFASSDKKAAFGLPGNPVAVFLMFHLFVLHAARLMSGLTRKLRYIKLPLAHDFHRSNAQRTAFLPCQLTSDGMLKAVDYHGTAHLLALMNCDGFFVVPKEVTQVHAGETVSYLSIKDSFA